MKHISTDQSVLDLEIASRLGWVSFSVIQLLGTMVVMSQETWQVFVIFVPVTTICICYQVSASSFSILQTHWHIPPPHTENYIIGMSILIKKI